jgi:putative membrane protein
MMKNLGVVIGIVLIVLLIVLLVGGVGMMRGYNQSEMMGLGRGGFGSFAGPLGFGIHLFRSLLSIVFWGCIIGGAVWLVTRMAKGSPASTASAETPLGILKTRYAKGEINKEQFDQIKQDIA